jgi:hypothetical protein
VRSHGSGVHVTGMWNHNSPDVSFIPYFIWKFSWSKLVFEAPLDLFSQGNWIHFIEESCNCRFSYQKTTFLFFMFK